MAETDLAVTAVVLCGGSGRRFAGRDKPLEPLAGRPLVGHVLARLQNQVGAVVISANRNLAAYAQFGYPVVADQLADRGPLAGIQAALSVLGSGVDEAADDQWLFVCPGDAPLLPTDLTERLRAGLTGSSEIAVPHDGERAQHLFMLLQRSAAEEIGSYLEQGGRSVNGWLAGREVVEVSVPDPTAFTNVNTEEELARAAFLL